MRSLERLAKPTPSYQRKTADFRDLLMRSGPPPRVVWLTLGNATDARIREVFEGTLPKALLLLETEPLVEISD